MARHGGIGVDVGGTKTLVSLFDDRFALVEMVKFKTQASKNEKQFERHLTSAVARLLKKARRNRMTVMATGAGCAGRIDSQTQTILHSPNIPFLKKYPLGKTLKALTGTEVFLGNDVHMGLYGEHALGAAVGVSDVLGIFIGTGVGGALMINGTLHLGASGVAGDIGHYLVQPFGPLGGSARMGVLDDVASRTAIAAAAAAFVAKQWAPHLGERAGTDLANIGSQSLAEAIKKGDRSIEELVRSRAHILGIVLSNLVDFINPQMVVLGGGLVDEMPVLMRQEIERGIREHATTEAAATLQVVTSKLKGQAVAAGAARMAWDRLIAGPSRITGERGAVPETRSPGRSMRGYTPRSTRPRSRRKSSRRGPPAP